VHMHHSFHDDDSRHGDMAGGAEHHLAVLSPVRHLAAWACGACGTLLVSRTLLAGLCSAVV
jgi:hypothetical protein